MKKLLTAVVALALALTVVAPAAASAQTSASYTFNTNLKVGSRGADVVALQTFLEGKGLLTIPAGTSKGYFGQLTKSAVAAYQTMKGITPAAGYFGPITRAAVMADMAAPATGTGSTGTTGTTGTTQPTMNNNGAEGVLDIRQATSPTNDSNIQVTNDVPVYGVEFKARLADVSVQTLRIAATSTLSGSNENPGTFINTIKVWDGTNVLATIPVNSGSFTKDTTSNTYYIQITGLNFVVPKDATKVLTLSFSVGATDSSTGRTVSVGGFSANSVRAVSANGVNTFYDISGITRTHVFMRPGTSTLTLSGGTPILRSMNNRVNSTNQVIIPALNFTVKSETGDSVVTSVTATSSVSGLVLSNDVTYYLYDGSTVLDSRTGASSVTFSNLRINVPKDVNKVLTVKVGINATSSSVLTAMVSTTTVTSVAYDKPNGSTGTATGYVQGVGQYVYTAAPMITLTSTPSITVSNAAFSGTSATSTLTAVFPLTVTPMGGDWDYSVATATVKFIKSDNTSVNTTANATVVHNPVNTNIPQNTAGSVTLSATVTGGSTGLTTGTYYAQVNGITWKVGSITVTQTYGLTDFVTPPSSSAINI